MTPKPDFPNILTNFNIKGHYMRAKPHGFGHINDTYATYFRKENGEVRPYILQRINHEVFKKPEEVMENVTAVTDHIRRKVIAAGGNPNRETLTLIPTLDGKTFDRTQAGDYWRVYHPIENASTHQIPASLQHITNAGRAYGNFQLLLGDFPVNQLYETIPDFHNTAKRFERFMSSLEKDEHRRAKDARDEIDFVLQRADEMPVLVDLVEQGKLPMRVTHNDTKYNNVMIDNETGEGICVIDLDTVMPGSALYDFGDAIRSITNTGEEDEADLTKVHFSMVNFKRYVQGYLGATGDTLNKNECKYLAFSARLMTLECGMRFLSDYLDGDKYFRIHRQNHNLDRCRTQFRLVAEMEARYEEMMQVIFELS